MDDSVFLPRDFDGRPIGLIAGKGYFPILTAERIRKAGLPLRLISFKGESERALIDSVPPEDHLQIKVGQLGKLLRSLQKLNCGYALMAGQITPKRLFHGLHPDIKALKILNGLKIRNAETIFGKISAEIEALNIKVLDTRCWIDDQLASKGLMTPGQLKAAPDFIEHGIRIAKAVANLDIGQGAVVRQGTVIAIEAYEGTDNMLKRAGSFKTGNLIFIKTGKSRQDYRFDVPVFGERTLNVMHEAGIQTAAFEAGCIIMLNKPYLLKKAKRLKIELFGYE